MIHPRVEYDTILISRQDEEEVPCFEISVDRPRELSPAYDEEARRLRREVKFANLKCKCHARFRGVCVVGEFLLLRRELKPVVHGTQGPCKVKNKCNEAVASYSDSSLPDQARLTLKRNFFLRGPS